MEGAPSLVQLAQRACIRNIKALTDIGDVPYDSAIRPVLRAIERPEQLRDLELRCPQIIGKDGEIWVKFIKRDCTHIDWEKVGDPEVRNPANWYKVYRKHLGLAQEEERKEAEKLRAIQAGVKEARAAREVQWKPNEELPRQPKVGGMIFAREPKQKKRPPPRPMADVLRFGAGSRTKVLTGKGAVDKAKREARERAHLRPGGGNLSTPSHLLKIGVVTKAPLSMRPPKSSPIAQRPIPSAAAKRAETAVAALGQPTRPLNTKGPSPLSTEEKERRLRELTKRRDATAQRNPSSSPPLDYSDPAIVTPNSLPPPRVPTLATSQEHMASPEPKLQQPKIKKRAAADPLMPVKRRKISA